MNAFNPADFYERVAKYYPEETINSFSEYWKALDFVVHSHLDGIEGTLIDVGCGKGRYSCYYKHGNVLGLDIAPTNVKTAALRATLIKDGIERKFIAADITLPQPFCGFQNVICIETLEHLPTLGHAFQNLKSFLAPAGTLFITVPNDTVTKWMVSAYLKEYEITDEYYHGGFNPKEITALLNNVGLNVKHCVNNAAGFLSVWASL